MQLFCVVTTGKGQADQWKKERVPDEDIKTIDKDEDIPDDNKIKFPFFKKKKKKKVNNVLERTAEWRKVYRNS